MSGILIARARRILKDEGITVLFKRALLYLRQNLFVFYRLNLYEHTLQAMNEVEYMPKIEGFTHRLISSNKQADEIAGQGFEDLRQCPILVDARRCLDKGAIAFCVYAGKELAHTGFVAMDEEAKKTFDIVPYKVDFAHGQACTGGTVTLPKYRGKGLMAYSYFKRLELLRQKGYRTTRNAIACNNLASRKVHERFPHRIYAAASIVRIAGMTFYREKACPDAINSIRSGGTPASQR